MAANVHAARVARETGKPYDEVRVAVNLLANHGVTNRAEAEQWVEEWAKEGCDDLIERAHDEIDEAVRSQ